MIETPRVMCCHCLSLGSHTFLHSFLNTSAQTQQRPLSAVFCPPSCFMFETCFEEFMWKIEVQSTLLCIYETLYLSKNFTLKVQSQPTSWCWSRLSHTVPPLTSPLSLSRRQSQAPPSWTGESHACVLPQSRAAPRALGKLFSMFVSSV